MIIDSSIDPNLNSGIDPSLTLESLQGLTANSSYYQSQFDTANLRSQAIKDAALSLGMQAGLYYESVQINRVLGKNESQLDKVFDFGILLYENNVLPPVIVDASNMVHLNDEGDMMRIAGKTYKIASQVRFVTAPPTWRDYLWMSYPAPDMPNRHLLPKTALERQAWQYGVAQGWTLGVDQAVTIYKINLNRLVQDFDGMILYEDLLLKNMVSPFYVEKKYYGVTGSGSQMAIDDENWTITVKPELQLHSKLWNPIVQLGDQNGSNSSS
jgi:defect-in-organelle-trafficking protein DotC